MSCMLSDISSDTTPCQPTPALHPLIWSRAAHETHGWHPVVFPLRLHLQQHSWFLPMLGWNLCSLLHICLFLSLWKRAPLAHGSLEWLQSHLDYNTSRNIFKYILCNSDENIMRNYFSPCKLISFTYCNFLPLKVPTCMASATAEYGSTPLTE